MTEITMSELKIIGIQIVVMAILGVFMLLYSSSPIAPVNAPNTANNASTTVSADDQGWISQILYIPEGMGELAVVSALVIGTFLLFDAFIAIRFAKDIVTKWL